MRRVQFAGLLLLVSAPAVAQDELRPVAPGAFVGRPYEGGGLPSEIEFVNARRTPVRLEWIGFDGVARVYAEMPPGGEILQPTFVGHRWLVTRAGGVAPIAAFVSTRSDVHSDGQPQIAVIR